jgi:hypothetical protein
MQNGFEVYQEREDTARIAEVERQLELANVSNEALQEAYSQAVNQMLRAEDIGWQSLSGVSGATGHDIEQSKRIARQLSDYVLTNPLLRRGLETRCSYLFSDPYEIGTKGAETTITPQQRNIIEKDVNQAAVFGLSALESMESQRYEAGNGFLLFDRTLKEFQQIPFEEIADIIYDPDNRAKLRYVKRSWTADVIKSDGKIEQITKELWIPVSKYQPGPKGYMKRIDGVPVDVTKQMVVSRANLKPGYTLGTPDAFSAAPWALAYSAYLRDGTKVLAALAEWVWKITPKKRPAAERAATAVRENRGAGGSLITDMDVQAMPKADAVDLNTGRPLAAQVASALGISIVILLSDPGQSGAYGTAATLNDPNRRTMQARRELNTEYLLECLRLVGIKDPAIVWSKMAPGSDADEMTLLNQAWGTGMFSPEEIRPNIAKVAQITVKSESAPAGILIPNNEASLPRSDVDADGTNSQSNGIGRDNAGVGALSRPKPVKKVSPSDGSGAAK